MAIQELDGMSLTGKIRLQARLNRIRGDRKSYDGDEWKMYGRNISEYEDSFRDALDFYPLKDLLKDKKNPIVIDIMSPSGALSTLFPQLSNEGKFGLALSLEDLRTREEKQGDAKLNIVQISGDILKSSTWDKIEKKLDGRKADLIMERAVDGLNYCIPKNPRLYAMLLNKAWHLLSEDGGVILAEFPGVYDILVWETIFALKDAESRISLRDDWGDCYLKLIKTPNSPEKLPFPADSLGL
jgi:hypothetical protein